MHQRLVRTVAEGLKNPGQVSQYAIAIGVTTLQLTALRRKLLVGELSAWDPVLVLPLTVGLFCGCILGWRLVSYAFGSLPPVQSAATLLRGGETTWDCGAGPTAAQRASGGTGIVSAPIRARIVLLLLAGVGALSGGLFGEVTSVPYTCKSEPGLGWAECGYLASLLGSLIAFIWIGGVQSKQLSHAAIMSRFSPGHDFTADGRLLTRVGLVLMLQVTILVVARVIGI